MDGSRVREVGGSASDEGRGEARARAAAGAVECVALESVARGLRPMRGARMAIRSVLVARRALFLRPSVAH
jgi:hypothetical protein